MADYRNNMARVGTTASRTGADIDEGLRGYMLRVYNYMAIALAVTGWVSARLGGAPAGPALLRNIGMGLLTMAVTFGVGHLFGTAVGI